jgi:chromate transporter
VGREIEQAPIAIEAQGPAMRRSPLALLGIFLRLGCTSFGGPVAHLAYVREAFVRKRGWLDDALFAECIAFTQLLPGPGSSQTAMLIGWIAGGPLGLVAAWIGFTAPSAIAMAALALAGERIEARGAEHALLLVAVAVVAEAVVTMRVALAPDAARFGIALAAILFLLLAPWTAAPLIAIAAGAAIGATLLRGRIPVAQPRLDLGISRRTGAIALVLFAACFAVLGLLATSTHAPAAILAGDLFRIVSLVFGGGHIVLPLMQHQLVAAGVVDQRSILAGYALAQAMPGPLFTIASYVGGVAFNGTLGWYGALLGTVAIFAPSFFLVVGIAPFYRSIARNERARSALAGVNAAVVGLLAAALVEPIGSTAIRSWLDAGCAVAAFVLLRFRVPPIALVIAGLVAGFTFAR